MDEEKIKSISSLTDIVIEEATELTFEKYSQLQIRLRSRKKYNQMLLMFNPISKANYVYKTFFENGTPNNCLVVHSNYTHNKFLPADNIAILEEMKETNYNKWLVYAMGHFASLGKTIFTNYEVKEFDEQELRRNGIKCYFGGDYGYTNDPSAFIKVYVDQENLTMYIADEMYEKGYLNSDIYNWIYRRGYSKEFITMDSSEPKSNEEMRRMGLNKLHGARKGKDSVIHGIQFIKNFKLVISPSCPNFITEVENYTWKKDKVTGEYLNVPEDNFNHLCDSLRYAVESIMPRNRLRSMDKIFFGF
jgi:phage terminase, large subunit, PBSX family